MAAQRKTPKSARARAIKYSQPPTVTQPPSENPRRTSALVALALATLVILSLGARLCAMRTEYRAGELHLEDPDTLRRIVRLRHIVEAEATYPYRDANDGWYADPARRGTVLHWTLPMDGAILALDSLVAPLYPNAARFTAGAAWAGPLIGTLAIVVYFLLARRWLRPFEAFVAALLCSLCYGSIAVGAFANGDHGALQQLCATVALLGFLTMMDRDSGATWPIVAGVPLGLGIWVSAETVVVFYAMAIGAAAGLLFVNVERASVLARRHLQWAFAAVAVAAVGDRLEHAGGWTFDWDVVSGFQLYQLLVFIVFAASVVGLLRARKTTVVAVVSAVACALALSIAPFALSATLRGALVREFAKAHAANLWAQSQVSEYAGLFSIEGFFVPARGWEILTWLVFALPVCAVVLARDRHRSPELRTALVAAASVLFAFTCYELKLAHLFAIVYAIVLVVGGAPLLDRAAAWFGWKAATARTVGALVAVGSSLFVPNPVLGIPLWRALLDAGGTVADMRTADTNAQELLIAELEKLPVAEGPQRAVLADWPLGAYILYGTEHPVVASGYHRNLDGIRDAYRVFIARLPEDAESLATILHERGVRWIVTRNDAHLFVAGSRSFPALGEFGRIETITYIGDGAFKWLLAPTPPDTMRTFLWRAHIASWIDQPMRIGDIEIREYADIPRGSLQQGHIPAYIIYEVVSMQNVAESNS